jgi:hypothetical protein
LSVVLLSIVGVSHLLQLPELTLASSVPARMRQVVTLAALALALGAAGCSSLSSGPAATTGSSGSLTDRMAATLFGAPGSDTAQPAAGGAPTGLPDNDLDCPSVDVRRGASTLQVYGSGEQNPTNLSYQANIVQLARQCSFTQPSLTMKVGIEGRIVLGPIAAPAHIEVPLRMAVVQEGPEPKTIWTKLYHVSVDMPAGQTNVPFTEIEPDLTIPRPKASDLESYVIYVGFDQLAMKAQPRRRAPARHRAKPAPAAR